MWYRITGADSTSGRDIEVIIDAADESEAEREALTRGVFVSSIVPDLTNAHGTTRRVSPHAAPPRWKSRSLLLLIGLAVLVLACIVVTALIATVATRAGLGAASESPISLQAFLTAKPNMLLDRTVVFSLSNEHLYYDKDTGTLLLICEKDGKVTGGLISISRLQFDVSSHYFRKQNRNGIVDIGRVLGTSDASIQRNADLWLDAATQKRLDPSVDYSGPYKFEMIGPNSFDQFTIRFSINGYPTPPNEFPITPRE